MIEDIHKVKMEAEKNYYLSLNKEIVDFKINTESARKLDWSEVFQRAQNSWFGPIE